MREMPYLIDGHNLIASLPEISLQDPDDEALLVEVLAAFCSRVKKRATVYFDRGARGAQNPLRVGGVTIRFVKSPKTADQAIISHLNLLAGEARNWTVVSSDRAIRRAAENAGSRVLSSQEFVHQLHPTHPPSEPPEKPSAPGSQQEISFWEDLFRQEDP
jgi:predicted RNA-binding protein with PIN domain